MKQRYALIKSLRRKYPDLVHWKNLKSDEFLRCDFCLDLQSHPNNLIIVCELCLAGVHQACYGREIEFEVPVIDWFCERCSLLRLKTKKNEPLEINCSLCPDTKGIMLTLSKGPMKL